MPEDNRPHAGIPIISHNVPAANIRPAAPDSLSVIVIPDAPIATPAIDDYENIDWDRIPKFQLPTHPSRHRAWIWTQGYDVEETRTGDRYWLCRKCHVARNRKGNMWKANGGTSMPLKHMKEVHQITENGPVTKKRTLADAFKQPDGSLTSRDRDIVHRLMTAFNPKRFKTKLTRWIVHDNVAFNQIESPYFRDLMLELNDSLGELDCLPTHKSIRDWIIKDFDKFKGTVAQCLHDSCGKIHMSFDLWSSRNLLSLCGIVVHFIDKHGKLRIFLLSLPEIVGSHSGLNIAESVSAIINEFGLENRIGYFVLDNADNNDTAIATLAEKFGFDACER
jgi:hypothetical protein